MAQATALILDSNQGARRYRLPRRVADIAPSSSLGTGRACRSWSALRIEGKAPN